MTILTVALGSSARSNVIDEQQQLTLHELAAVLHAGWHWGKLLHGHADVEAAKADKDTRWFSLAKFRAPVRNGENVESVSGFVGDFDKGTWSPDEVATVLTGLQSLIYTTYSNSAAHAKFRLVVPYTRPVSVADHTRLWLYFDAMFEGALDGAAKDAPRLFYFPSSCPDTGPPVSRFELREGALFDPVTVLASLPTPSAAPSPRSEAEWTTEPVPQWSGPDDDAELIARAKRSRSANATFGGGVSFNDLYTGDPESLQRAYPPQSAGHAWNASAADIALCNMLAYWTGGNMERMEKLMRESALYRHKHERTDYLRGTIQKACASVAERGNYYNDGRTAPVAASDSRTVIQLNGGSLRRNIAALQPLVAESVYVRGGSLVRIGHAEQVANGKLSGGAVEVGGTRRSFKQAVCIPVTADWLRLELMNLAQFWQYDERTGRWKEKNCPEEISNSIIKQGSWSEFAPLLTIASTPILRGDLSVWTQPGYDAETGIFYQPTMTIPPVVATPTRDDALAALARLREPFDEFPFSSPAAESVLIAHIIAAVIRASFATSPIFVYSAPIVASGKTLISDMPGIIAQGVDHPAHHNYDEKEELKKVLFSSLLAGDSALTIDNLPEGTKIRSPALANFATSGTYAGRVLGLSKVVELPNRCTVTMTGNNVTPVGEIARRSLVCRLDVNAESARGRTFRVKNLRAYVRERRAQLIVDVLSIVRAYAFAGRPVVTKSPLESFDEWSALVRDPLVWLGMADPVTSQETETDEEVSPLRGAFVAIAAATQHMQHTFTAAQLLELVLNPMLSGGVKLREALDDAGCKEPAEKLGYWLRAKKDNVAAGLKLVNELNPHTGVANWRLRAP